jgi:ankyrin repeat protein
VLVYFLDKPLIGNPTQPRAQITQAPRDAPITTWQELCMRYRGIGAQLEAPLRKLFDEFQDELQVQRDEDAAHSRTRTSSLSSIRPASLRNQDTEHTFSQEPSLIQLRFALEHVLASAIGTFQGLPQNLLHRIGLETSLKGTDIENMIEAHCLASLYDLTLHRLSSITAYKDEEASQAIEACKYVDLTQLGTQSTLDIRNRLVLAVNAFTKFTTSHTPNEKLQALLDTIHILMTDSEKSSDDLIPCLVAVLLRSSPPSSWANILLIREFSYSDVEMGERGFALSTLEAVLYHITSSSNSLSSVSSRNKRFFDAIREDDFESVESMISEHSDLLEVRDPKDQTPLRLASPRIAIFLLSQGSSASSLSHSLLRHMTTDAFDDILRAVAELDTENAKILLNQQDDAGQTLAHKVCDRPDIIYELSDLLDWRHRDNSGCTPLLILARIYDHPKYEQLLEMTLSAITTSCPLEASSSDDESFVLPQVIRRIPLEDHIDPKGNTLAHIVSTRKAMETIFKYCHGNFNLLNDRGHSPLLISIKFARQAILDFLLSRPEVDGMGRDARGHSAIHYAAHASLPLFNTCVRHGLDINDRAVGSGITPLHIASREGNLVILKRLLELDAQEAWDWRGFRPGDIVKNDQVRAILDDWACRGKEVRVLRGHVGDDCTVKYLIKVRNGGGVLRSVADFVNLRQWLSKRYRALGIPTLAIHTPAPCLLHSRPARSVLLAVTERLDAFVQSLLSNPQIRENQIFWEFLLSPTRLDVRAVQDVIDRETHAEVLKIWQEEKPLTDYASAEVFFQHAREQLLVVSSSYQVFERKIRAVRDGQLHLSVAYGLLGKALSSFSPRHKYENYAAALSSIGDCLAAREPSLLYRLTEEVISVESRAAGIVQSLTLPSQLLERIRDYSADIERGNTSLARNKKFALGLLADSRARQKAQITHSLQELHLELNHTSCELRRTETVLADGLSQFYEQHARSAKLAILNFCKSQVKDEKARLVGMERCMLHLRGETSSFVRHGIVEE